MLFLSTASLMPDLCCTVPDIFTSNSVNQMTKPELVIVQNIEKTKHGSFGEFVWSPVLLQG